MKSLIIAEKPSVAADLAKALGKFKKENDYYESADCIIASAVGHLVELAMPQEIDEKFKSWNLKHLPIIPETFILKPIEKTSKKLDALKTLMSRKDVDVVINACDAGREGELIFTYIYELAKCKKPTQRMWMMSMTKTGILEAFGHLKTSQEMLPLQQAARCRSESDWLIGINGTRAITSRLFGFKGGQAATVGRVQTPTLALVVEREKEIRNFIPRPYYRITGQFQVKAGEYEGVLQRSDFKKNADEHDRIDRIWDKDSAQAIVNALSKPTEALVSDEKKRTTQAAPRLYDLTTLQREANNRFSLPAGRTLQILQGLYERHKMITYPRTDSKALPEDYVATCQETLASITGACGEYAQTVLQNKWVQGSNKRIFNNQQVSDHFAIIPTNQTSEGLSHDEFKIYDMIVRRFIAVFYPSAEYDVTTRLSTIANYTFKTEGKVLVVPGWLAVHGKDAQAESNLPALQAADGTPPKAKALGIHLHEETTKPPARYTEATLLAAMEGAGKLVDDDELAEAMKEKGLGTPATRAQTIEHIIYEKYLERDHRDLIPTTKAEHLIELLKALKIEHLTSPVMTGEWEFRLRQIEHGTLTRSAFMEGISQVTTDIVEKTKNFDETATNSRVTDILSPIDEQPLIETIRAYRSASGDFNVNKVISNRRMQEDEVRQLIKDRTLGPLDGFKSKAGKPFSAVLKLDEEHKVRFVFDKPNNEGGTGEPSDLTQYPTLCKCPKSLNGLCGQSPGNIYELPSSYACEYHINKSGTCDFRLSRTLLGRTIDTEQFLKLAQSGRTDLLDKFRSKRTGRFFSAYLVLKPTGEIGFEFEAKKTKGSEEGSEKPASTKKTSTPKKKVATKRTTIRSKKTDTN